MSLFGHKQKTVEPDVIPTTVEQAIPIRDVCEDGIFLVGRNLWSKTYRFTDVNYATASKEDKEGMFFAYSEILNTFDAGAMTKITVNNRRLNQTKFRENNMLELQGDSLDKYRNEYNRILAGNANLSNGITQDKYLTVTVEKKTEEEARAHFNRISAEFAALFAKLGSKFEEVTAEVRRTITTMMRGCMHSVDTASRMPLHRTVWNFVPTISKWTGGTAGYCICATMPILSRTASSRS